MASANINAIFIDHPIDPRKQKLGLPGALTLRLTIFTQIPLYDLEKDSVAYFRVT